MGDTDFSLGEVQIHNITFRSELVDGEDAVTMTVYYADTPDDNTVARYSGDIPEHWPRRRCDVTEVVYVIESSTLALVS